MLRLANRVAARVSASTLSAISHRRVIAAPRLLSQLPHRCGLTTSAPRLQQQSTPTNNAATPQQTNSENQQDERDSSEKEKLKQRMLWSRHLMWLIPLGMYLTSPTWTEEDKKDFREYVVAQIHRLGAILHGHPDPGAPEVNPRLRKAQEAKLQAAAATPSPDAPAAVVAKTSTPAPVAEAVAATTAAPAVVAASSPPPSIQPPSTASSAATPSDDNIDWRKTPVDFPPDEDQAFSAAVSTEKLSEHISPMVAIEIAEKIYRRDENVLLQIYAPWCGACKMLTPVVQTVSKVLHQIEQEPTAEGQKPVQHISVYAMDGDANNLPGFLTKEESRALPLVKFFPKCGSQKNPDAAERDSPACQAQLYEFKPNTKNILEFVLAGLNAQPNLEKENRKVEVDKALGIAAKLEEETQVKVLKALEIRFAADSASTPSLKVHEIAPCGDKLHRIMQNFMLSSYRSPGFLRSEKEEDERGLEMFEDYRTCTEKEEKNLEEFWEQVKKQAEDALEGIENKKKQNAPEATPAAPAVEEKKTESAPVVPSSNKVENKKEEKKQN